MEIYVSPQATEYEHLLYDVDKDHICWLTLNRPEKLNAMNVRLIAELQAAFLRAEADTDVNVVVLRGAGRSFCAGHDLDEDAADVAAKPDMHEYRQHYLDQYPQFTRPWQITKPVIASVHGHAIGKGFEITLFCDATIIASDCQMGYKELRYGLPGFAMFLPWLVPMKVAKDLILTGREVSAQEAKEIGLVTKVVAPDELEEATRKYAGLMAAMPREMQRMHKRYINHLYELQGLQTGTAYYLELMAELSMTPVAQYVEFTQTTLDRGLRAALEEANARYDKFEDD